jgi:hypothetical protein
LNCNSGTGNNDGQSHEFFTSNDVKFTTITIKKFLTDMWILDSGTSFHNCWYMKGLTEVREISKSIKIEKIDSMKATKIRNQKYEVT